MSRSFNLNLLFFCASFLTSLVSYGQDMTIFQGNSRSKAAMQFYQEEFKRVGAYKVKGNSLVLEGNNVSDLYSSLGPGANLPIVFDAYSQELSIMLENKQDVVKLSFEEVDSFIVKLDTDKKYAEPTLFLNAHKIEPSKKMYMQRLATGPKYSLFKSFYTELRPAASDLAQTNVREFEIVSEYYYLPAKGAEFTKIKKSSKAVKKLFESEKEAIDKLGNEFDQNFEVTLVKFFDILNGQDMEVHVQR